jgi:hypothetical protein
MVVFVFGVCKGLALGNFFLWLPLYYMCDVLYYAFIFCIHKREAFKTLFQNGLRFGKK